MRILTFSENIDCQLVTAVVLAKRESSSDKPVTAFWLKSASKSKRRMQKSLKYSKLSLVVDVNRKWKMDLLY